MFLLAQNVISYNQKNMKNLHMQFYSSKLQLLSIIYKQYNLWNNLRYIRTTYNQILVI